MKTHKGRRKNRESATAVCFHHPSMLLHRPLTHSHCHLMLPGSLLTPLHSPLIYIPLPPYNTPSLTLTPLCRPLTPLHYPLICLSIVR